MILRDCLETIVVPSRTTIEVIDSTNSKIGYVKLYTSSSLDMFFERIKQYLDNEVYTVVIIPRENCLKITIYLI